MSRTDAETVEDWSEKRRPDRRGSPLFLAGEAQKKAVRRALRGLAREGLIVGPLRERWRWNVAKHPLDAS
jgi:hypothetical protein